MNEDDCESSTLNGLDSTNQIVCFQAFGSGQAKACDVRPKVRDVALFFNCVKGPLRSRKESNFETLLS